MILDGFGINEKEEGNGVKQANIPHLNEMGANIKQFDNNAVIKGKRKF